MTSCFWQLYAPWQSCLEFPSSSKDTFLFVSWIMSDRHFLKLRKLFVRWGLFLMSHHSSPTSLFVESSRRQWMPIQRGPSSFHCKCLTQSKKEDLLFPLDCKAHVSELFAKFIQNASPRFWVPTLTVESLNAQPPRSHSCAKRYVND